jgi:hypothetical protein
MPSAFRVVGNVLTRHVFTQTLRSNAPYIFVTMLVPTKDVRAYLASISSGGQE